MIIDCLWFHLPLDLWLWLSSKNFLGSACFASYSCEARDRWTSTEYWAYRSTGNRTEFPLHGLGMAATSSCRRRLSASSSSSSSRPSQFRQQRVTIQWLSSMSSAGRLPQQPVLSVQLQQGLSHSRFRSVVEVWTDSWLETSTPRTDRRYSKQQTMTVGSVVEIW